MIPKNVLFLCTHNSARSQMAEGLLRTLGKGEFITFSAGTTATAVRAEAVTVMREIDIDISDQRSKTLNEYLSKSFEFVITLCDNMRETCPVFPNARQYRHWSIDDPSQVQGSEAARLDAFRRVRDKLRQKIESEILGRRVLR